MLCDFFHGILITQHYDLAMEHIVEYWNEIICGITFGLAVGSRIMYWNENQVVQTVKV